VIILQILFHTVGELNIHKLLTRRGYEELVHVDVGVCRSENVERYITWFISKSPTQVSRPLDLTRENQKNRVL
jgi:hypothetical protein